MEYYVTHQRFRDYTISGRMNLPYGTKIEYNPENNLLFTMDGKPICYATSYNAHKFFSPDNDGRGLERGKLTYAIAFGRKIKPNKDGHAYKFTEEEINTLKRDWKKFLKVSHETILFNHDFFCADIEDLQKIADVLNIKVK